MKKKGTVFGKDVGMVLAMTLICGVLYTIVVTGVSQLFFSDKANGSVIEIDGKKGSIIFFVGLTLPRYSFSKPSASLDRNLRQCLW